MGLPNFSLLVGEGTPASGRMQPHPVAIPSGVLARESHKLFPSGSATNPGYAYDTLVPLNPGTRGNGIWRFFNPFTIPVAPTRFNQVPMSWNNSTQWINPGRALRVKGQTVVTGWDHQYDGDVQAYLANATG